MQGGNLVKARVITYGARYTRRAQLTVRRFSQRISTSPPQIGSGANPLRAALPKTCPPRRARQKLQKLLTR